MRRVSLLRRAQPQTAKCLARRPQRIPDRDSSGERKLVKSTTPQSFTNAQVVVYAFGAVTTPCRVIVFRRSCAFPTPRQMLKA
jgi:hypothetical protein